ncbi:MAG: hypothetical protein ACXWVI_05085 [Methyloceanibacter sp.]
MLREELIFVGTCDIAGHVRGTSVQGGRAVNHANSMTAKGV